MAELVQFHAFVQQVREAIWSHDVVPQLFHRNAKAINEEILFVMSRRTVTIWLAKDIVTGRTTPCKFKELMKSSRTSNPWQDGLVRNMKSSTDLKKGIVFTV